MSSLPSRSLQTGARVRYWTGVKAGPGKIGYVKFDGIYELASGKAVVYIVGVGAVALSHVEPIEPIPETEPNA
jgi:hypothetical protein